MTESKNTWLQVAALGSLILIAPACLEPRTKRSEVLARLDALTVDSGDALFIPGNDAKGVDSTKVDETLPDGTNSELDALDMDVEIVPPDDSTSDLDIGSGDLAADSDGEFADNKDSESIPDVPATEDVVGIADGVDTASNTADGDATQTGCTPISCDDGNSCTVDSCNLQTGVCQYSPKACSQGCFSESGSEFDGLCYCAFSDDKGTPPEVMFETCVLTF